MKFYGRYEQLELIGRGKAVKPASLTVTLYADDTATDNVVTLNEGNNWTSDEITDLPKYRFDSEQNKNVEIGYHWVEEDVSGGWFLTDSSTDGTVTTITNTYQEFDLKTSYIGTKTWQGISEEDTMLIVQTLHSMFNGVYAMSLDMPGLVETSSNLASVKMGEDVIKVVTSQRSSIESQRRDVSSVISATFRLGGFVTETLDGYPGWKPNPHSEILGVTVESYKRLFGKEPIVRAIHAGLECGLFLTQYPFLDMVSFGPTLRGVHSPDERLLISTVDMYWRHLLDVLKNIPEKA